jgi:hypothetical protein
VNQQHDGSALAGRPVADPVAVQDDLLLAGKQIVQVAPGSLVNRGFVACLGGDVCLLGKVAAEPASGPIRSGTDTRYTSFGHASNRKMLLTQD